MQEQNRQLAAILFTDIVGYTAMMQKDEQNALVVTRHFITSLKQVAGTFHGRILNDYGDGSLCCFPSATEAVKAAVQLQQQLQQEPKVPLRIGIHVGEFFFEESKVMGDSVNVASRIQSLGCANSILFSREVFDKLKNQPEYRSVSLGKFEFKHVDEPLEVFALANEGLIVPRKEDMSGKLKEIQKKYARRKWIITTSALVLLIAAFFIYKNISGNRGFTGDKSIAVLPFENTGTDSSEEYISDGITQDIINNLSKISSLQKIIGWFSVRSFRNTTKSLKQIADELGVVAILSGTIQKHEGKVHIIAELIEVSTNKRLWGDDFEYDSKDVLSIQTEIAEEIVTALKIKVTPEEKKNLAKHYTENVEAYKYYRKGRAFWDLRTAASYDSAEANYKRALELDPDYAIAYAGLADCYTFNQQGLSQMEAIQIARDYTNKALMLDSNLTEALTTRAFIQSHYDYDWKGAKVAFEKIIHDNPNYSIAHLYYGNVLIFTGNIEAGINETKKALALEPLSSALNMVLGRNYYYSRNYDQAITQIQKTVALNPNFRSAYWVLGNSFLQKKLYPQAINAFSKLPSGMYDIGINGMIVMSYVYAFTGDTIKAKEEFNKISKEDYATLSSVAIAPFYIYMSNFNEALTQLEKAFDTHELGMIGLKVDPIYDPIRNEPRFKALLKKANFE